MPLTSKSNQRKPNKQRQVRVVRQPTTNWLELPSDVTANILFRVGVCDILKNVEKVCTAWQKICKDPAMWRTICMDYSYEYSVDEKLSMCKQAVDRSQGQLIDITIGDFGNYELLEYVADRSSQLRHLKIISCDASLYKSWKALKKFPLLEELGLYSKKIPEEAVKAICHYCPSSLKTLKMNEYSLYRDYEDSCDKMGILIGENLHELEHLELIGNNMTDIGLQAILDGCRRLKLLDLRMSCSIEFEGGLKKRCLEQIDCLIHPDEALGGSQYIYGYDDLLRDPEDYEFDEWLSSLQLIKFYDLSEMLAFMPMFG